MIPTLKIVADFSEQDAKCEKKIVALEKNGNGGKTDKFITRQPVVANKKIIAPRRLVICNYKSAPYSWSSSHRGLQIGIFLLAL